MAVVKYGRFEKDTYKINSTTSNYVHNHYDNFEKVLKDNTISFDGLYKDFKSLWNSMLTDLIDTWERIRKIFIQKFVDEEEKLKKKNKAYDPIFKRIDPQDFLEDYNSYFKEIQKEDSLVRKLQKIKSSTIVVSDQLGGIRAIKESTNLTDKEKTKKINEAKKEALKSIRGAWEDLIGMVSTVINNQLLDDITMKKFLLEGKGRKEITEENDVFEVDYDFFTKNILEIFQEKFKIKDLKTMKSTLKRIEKIAINDPKNSREEKEIREVFKNFTEGAISGAAGYLLEQAMIEVIVNNELLSMVAKLNKKDSVSKISYTGSERMKQRFIGDHLTASVKYEDKIVRVFTSDKLTRSLDIGSEFRSKEYVVPNDPILTNYKWDGENRDILKWMRYNFNTLKILNLGKGSRESLSEIPDKPFQSYFNLEKDIASLLIIPRFVEGVVNFAENIKGVYKDGEIYHTAMLYSRDEFIWTVDILKKLQEIMNSSNSWEKMGEKGIVITNFRKAPEPIMTETQVYALYTKKIEALKNNNIKNYEQLIQIAGIADTVLKWKPIHKVGAWMQFSKILGGK